MSTQLIIKWKESVEPWESCDELEEKVNSVALTIKRRILHFPDKPSKAELYESLAALFTQKCECIALISVLELLKVALC